MLDSSSTFVRLKNDLNIFQSKKLHETGKPAFKQMVSEPLTLVHKKTMLVRKVMVLIWNLNSRALLTPHCPRGPKVSSHSLAINFKLL